MTLPFPAFFVHADLQKKEEKGRKGKGRGEKSGVG